MMSFNPSAIAALLLGVICFFALPAHSSGPTSNSPSKGLRGSDSSVMIKEIELDLAMFQEAALRGGSSSKAAQRLSKIEASMWQTFQALPKNQVGRLAPRAVRYIVHNYFAKEHGWLIKGLGPHGMQLSTSDLHEMSILQDQAPALVEALLESRQSNRGLALMDIAVLAASIERLILDEELVLLEGAYSLNNFSADEAVDESSLHELLRSFLLVYEVGRRTNFSDVTAHQTKKDRLTDPRSKGYAGYQAIIDFEQDAVWNFGFELRSSLNPFGTPQFSFHEASQIVDNLAVDYGKWQNMECRQMTDALISLNPDGSGRVPLKVFYSHPDGADFTFTESPEYLRKIGALEESAFGSPMVLIANYVTGPSNCIASSAYYSVCCMSDCESLMNDLEGFVQGPSAEAQQLLGFVANMSSPTVDAPRQLSNDLKNRLLRIADQQGGAVHLHGRLFAQWLHYAFPNECPYPHVTENADVLTAGYWLDNKDVISSEERQRHVSTMADVVPLVEPLAEGIWHEEEILPLSELQDARGRVSSYLRGLLRLAVMLALAMGVLRVAVGGWKSVTRATRSGFEKGTLPLHVQNKNLQGANASFFA